MMKIASRASEQPVSAGIGIGKLIPGVVTVVSVKDLNTVQILGRHYRHPIAEWMGLEQEKSALSRELGEAFQGHFVQVGVLTQEFLGHTVDQVIIMILGKTKLAAEKDVKAFTGILLHGVIGRKVMIDLFLTGFSRIVYYVVAVMIGQYKSGIARGDIALGNLLYREVSAGADLLGMGVKLGLVSHLT